MGKQHLALWRGTCNTQRQARELISGPDRATGPGYCPLIGIKPRLLLACLVDITHWEDIYAQGEHKVFPWSQTFITRKLRGIQTYFFFYHYL